MRVAFYGRVSTEEQAERGSIANQVEFARKFFDLHSESLNLEGYEVYLDDGISGAVPMENRPHGSRLMADAQAKKFNAVYVYRLDRLARNTLYVLSAYEFFEKHDIALRSMTEMFDTSTSNGKFFMTTLASIAALERDTILERTQLGKERAAREGRWTSGQPPYGYRIGEDRRLKIYEPEAEVVRLIFRLYGSGMYTVPIAEYLNARDIQTPTKSKQTKNTSTGKWMAGHISIILRNTVYIGEYKTMQRSKKKKEGVIIKTPVIVSLEDFKKANELLVKNSDVSRGSRGREYLLRGIIYCGKCGHAMVGNTADKRTGRSYYRCSYRNNMGNGVQCDNKQIKAKSLEDAIWNDIVNFIKNPGEVLNNLREKVNQDALSEEPIQQEMEQVDASIIEKKAAQGRIISLVGKGTISESEAETEISAIRRDIDVLNRRRDELFTSLLKAQEQKNTATNIAVALDKYKNVIDTISPIPDIVKLLVERIEIHTEERDGKPHSRAVVHYRFTPSKCGLELVISRDA